MKLKIDDKILEKSNVNMSPSLLLCECFSPEHQVVIYKDESDGNKQISLCFHLVTYKNIFKRIWVAIKYIFGYKSKYGEWDSVIITKRNYLPLKESVEFIEG